MPMFKNLIDFFDILISIKGTQGATGIKGAVGNTGAIGPTGSTGPIGSTGAQGRLHVFQ